MASTSGGQIEVRADLVVGCDGRHSTVRARAGLRVNDLGAPIDVLWFALPYRLGDPEESTGHFDVGRIFVRIFRGTHWQCGYVIPKDGLEILKAKGLADFRASVARSMPFAADCLEAEIKDWEQIKLLTIRVDRLETWHRPGLLCIGDAAHAMSPIGGVGINLAIQDAVAAANVLAVPLRDGALASAHLAQVQQRRMLPTRATQAMQLAMQKRIFAGVLGAQGTVLRPPAALRIATAFPPFRWLLARLLGLGVRPEHVASPVSSAY
jgi:2-polyprenyl-6-methoxyphenol hydroxylase-like FAD-dependent oxidoreductase